MNRWTTPYLIIVLVAGLLLSVLCWSRPFDEEKRTADWKTLVTSRLENDRVHAQHLVLDDRKDVIEYLVSVINSPLRPHEDFYTSTTSRNIAILLLGKLRAKEAIADLTNWLSPKPGQGLTIDSEPMYSPAGDALVEIGSPSVPPLLQLLKSASNGPLRREYLKIIGSILGQAHTQLLLEHALAKENSATKTDNLKAALDLLSDPKFQPIFRTCAKKSPLE
jgi:hypothetical protein